MLQRINAELAASWLAIADDGDRIWTPEPVADSFWEQSAAAGLPFVTGCFSPTPLANVTSRADETSVPWGWTPELARLPTVVQPDWEILRRANSRRTSFGWEQTWEVGLPGASAVTVEAEIEPALQRLRSGAESWVIKAEFGMSGRERRVGSGPLKPQDRDWISRRLKADGVVFVEPWVTAVAEAGLQFEIPGPHAEGVSSDPAFLGVVELLSDRGQYAGSIIAEPPTRVDWQPAITVATVAVRELQQFGYWGPVGIDAMAYRDATGRVRWRPLQDINARWTMGRLALGWRCRFPQMTHGVWWHGSRANLAQELPHRIVANLWPETTSTSNWQVIPTSPAQIGNTPAHHASVLIFREN